MRAGANHVGLYAVDAAHINGWSGTLMSCENCAHAMARIPYGNRLDQSVLLTQRATNTRLLQLIADQAARMDSGDRPALTFVGNVSLVRDLKGDGGARLDETWVLYDRVQIDDELCTAFAPFLPGVRLLVVPDSCYRASSVRMVAQRDNRFVQTPIIGALVGAHRWTYRRAPYAIPRTTPSDLRCSAISLAACQENQGVIDTDRSGLFTSTFKRSQARVRFSGNYLSFAFQMPYVRRIPPARLSADPTVMRKGLAMNH